MRIDSRLRTWLFAIALLVGPSSLSAQPPQQPPPAATDGFVPVESLRPEEQLPAAPLVMIAYAVAWVAVFGYLWSLWQRLGRVERDILEIRRRVEGAPRR